MRRVNLLLALGLCGATSLPALTLLTYNVGGNGAEDWSTNAPQVRAIARQIVFLQPDVLTFNEVPFEHSHEMTNFVQAFLPGYAVAWHSGTDGYIRSVILSRFPIRREQRWLARANLAAFGYDGPFTRDLFEAEIAVPDFPQPLHVFTTHLKSGSDATSAVRRAAEANAISNFFANGFLLTNALRAYVLTGDFNEDVARPRANSLDPVGRVANEATGLRLTTPLNPLTQDDRTFSARAGLTARYDYILPCGLLFSNVVRSGVFRVSLLNPPPPPLLPTDESTASDHLPVWMEFANPYPVFGFTQITRRGEAIIVTWPNHPGAVYEVQASADLLNWRTLTGGRVPEGPTVSWSVPADEPLQFFRIRRTQ